MDSIGAIKACVADVKHRLAAIEIQIALHEKKEPRRVYFKESHFNFYTQPQAHKTRESAERDISSEDRIVEFVEVVK